MYPLPILCHAAPLKHSQYLCVMDGGSWSEGRTDYYHSRRLFLRWSVGLPPLLRSPRTIDLFQSFSSLNILLVSNYISKPSYLLTKASQVFPDRSLTTLSSSFPNFQCPISSGYFSSLARFSFSSC